MLSRSTSHADMLSGLEISLSKDLLTSSYLRISTIINGFSRLHVDYIVADLG